MEYTQAITSIFSKCGDYSVSGHYRKQSWPLSIGHTGTNFTSLKLTYNNFNTYEIDFKMPLAKCRPYCLNDNDDNKWFNCHDLHRYNGSSILNTVRRHLKIAIQFWNSILEFTTKGAWNLIDKPQHLFTLFTSGLTIGSDKFANEPIEVQQYKCFQRTSKFLVRHFPMHFTSGGTGVIELIVVKLKQGTAFMLFNNMQKNPKLGMLIYLCNLNKSLLHVWFSKTILITVVITCDKVMHHDSTIPGC